MNTDAIRELIEAARPFLSGDVVDDTRGFSETGEDLGGTIPLKVRLERAIKAVEEALETTV